MAPRDHPHARAAWLLIVAIAASSVVAPRCAAAADETLELDVVVNGRAIGKLGEFMLRDGALFAQRQELQDLAFRVPDSIVAPPDGLIALTALPGVTMQLDRATQQLQVTATDDKLIPEQLLDRAAPDARGPLESSYGALMNYVLTGTALKGASGGGIASSGQTGGSASGGQTVGSGAFDAHAFSPYGVLSSGALAFTGQSAAGPGASPEIRLDTTYVYSDPDTLRRYRAGDVLAGGLGWSRPVRLGGVQISSDFAMRPDLVTFPLPTMSGSAAVPSTIDVLINGTRLMSRQVQPGPFELPQLPVVTGAGTVAMTMTDAMGRQVTTTLPFYASSTLLTPGLQSYSLEAGKVRNNWGLVSNDYGTTAASGTYRRGLLSWLTVEGHAEGSAGLGMAGSGLVVNVGNLGMINAAAASSKSGGLSGAQYTLGIERDGQVLSMGATATVAMHDFRDIASIGNDPPPRRSMNVHAGLSLGSFGSIGAAYTILDRDANPAPFSFFAAPGTFVGQTVPGIASVTQSSGGVVTVVPAQHAQIASASYSVQIGNVSVSATAFRDFSQGGTSGALLGLTIPLGVRSSASTNGGYSSGGGSGQVQMAQSAQSIGDWGYQAVGSAGPFTHEFAETQYKSPWGLVSAGADHVSGQTALRAGAQGALAFAGGGLFASNTINDSFAVVDTKGAEGIRVMQENRDVGRTDSSGRLLVPDLRSFDVNRLAIDPTDVPADSSLPFTSKEVRPQDRSGIVVEFPVQVSHGALLRLVDGAGKPIPLGSNATLKATGATVPVGFDGEAFVQGLESHNEVNIGLPKGGRCTVSFDYKPVPGEIPDIGPLACREIKS